MPPLNSELYSKYLDRDLDNLAGHTMYPERRASQ